MKSLVFRLTVMLAAAVTPAAAAPATAPAADDGTDSTAPADTMKVTDTVIISDTAERKDTISYTNYDRRVFRYRRLWNFLIPTQVIMQYAGNMGLMSIGMGWDYGNHRRFETNLLFGYLPKFESSSSKMTLTLKQNFIPWRIDIGNDFNFEPLSCGIYFNTVFGSEFWSRQPKRYPDKYYPFLSTKMRINVFVGERFTVIVPHNRRKFLKSLTAFYEISTCDLYIRAMVQDGHVSLWDILGLSLGIKAQLF